MCEKELQKGKVIMLRIFLLVLFVMIFVESKTFAKECRSYSSAKTMPNDARVHICGTLTKHLRGEYFELKNDTETIVVKIDNDFTETNIPLIGQEMQINGKVDKERYPDADEYEFSVEAKTIQFKASKTIVING